MDGAAALLAIGALVAMLRFKVGMIPTLGAAALLGGMEAGCLGRSDHVPLARVSRSTDLSR
ncbi:MAG: hypothetical protein AAB543_01660, partial [Pseudomonadota bacterium]